MQTSVLNQRASALGVLFVTAWLLVFATLAAAVGLGYFSQQPFGAVRTEVCHAL